MSSCLGDSLVYGGYAAVPTAISSGISTGAVATGRAFSFFATTSLPAVAVLSAAQTLLAQGIFMLLPKFDICKNEILTFVIRSAISHAISAAIVFGVTAIAVQVGIISSVISLPAAAIVILANFAFGTLGTWGYFIGAEAIEKCCNQ